MNSFLKTGMLVLAAACTPILTSCESDETDHGRAPSVGALTLDPSEDIRPGQTLTASVAVPTDGHNITSRTSYWFIDQTGMAHSETKNEGGRSYITFTAPTTPGEATVTYTQRVNYGAPDAKGNAYADVSSSKTYTVVPTDVYASKWTDTKAQTLNIYKGGTETTDTSYVVTVKDELSTSTTAQVERTFSFKNNTLSGITETSYAATLRLAAWNRATTLVKRAVSELAMSGVEGRLMFREGTSQNLTGDQDADRAIIAAAVDKLAAGEACIMYLLNSASTNLIIAVYKSTAISGDNSVTYIRHFFKGSAAVSTDKAASLLGQNLRK